MVFEYAIDPDAVVNWRHKAEYQFFVKEFGLGSPRALSAYPRSSQWRRKVLSAAKTLGLDGMDGERLTALINVLQENKIERGKPPYDVTKDWLVNAEQEHQRKSFHAIVSDSNPRGNSDVMPATITGVLTHPKWECASSSEVPRQPHDMAACVRNMLLLSRTVIFIDPHFQPGSDRYKDTIRAFLAVLVQPGAVGASRVEVHTNYTDNINASFVGVFQSDMPALTPLGMQVCLRRWRQRNNGEKLHDRFVLTNLGAVEFSVGLDKGNPGESTRVHLLNSELYRSCWKNYVATPAFDSPEAPVTIIGTRV
jgi:hypothetical protein